MNLKNYVLARRVSSMALAVCLSMGALALSACGGGGGSSGGGGNPPVGGPPPPPPPPPPNASPNLVIQLSATEVDENSKFTVDVTGSSDSDGSIVRVQVSQQNFLSGFRLAPDGFSSQSPATFEFTAPEVYSEATITVIVEIEDNQGAVVSGQADVRVLNVVDNPKSLAIKQFSSFDIGRPLTLLGPADPFDDAFIAYDQGDAATNGNVDLLILGDPDQAVQDFSIIRSGLIAGTVPSVRDLFFRVFNFNLGIGSQQEFAVVSPDADKLYWFVAYDQTDFYAYSNEVTVDIEAPCFVRGKTNSGQEIAWVGQEDVGLSVLNINPIRPDGFAHRGFDHSVLTTAGNGRSLCFVYPTRLEAPVGVFPISQLDDLIAVDFKSNELVLYVDRQAPAEQYEVLDVVPIDTGGAAGLHIVDVKASGAPGEVPRIIWILMTDGIHNGTHRLAVVSQDGNERINQDVLSWQGGVPVSLNIASIFGSEGRSVDVSYDVMIVSSTSDEAVVFEDEQIDLNVPLGSTPVYKPAMYFEIGGKAGSSQLVTLPNLNDVNAPRVGLLVSFPSDGTLKIFADTD